MQFSKMALGQLAAAVTVALASQAAVAQAGFSERTLRMSTGVGKDHPIGVAMVKMSQCAAEKSGGKMKLMGYYDNSLGNDMAATQQVRSGSQDIVLTSTAPLVGAIPQLAVFDLPFLFNNEKEADQILDGKLGQSFVPKFASVGLVHLSYWENGFRNVTNSRRPIAKWEDLQGIKLRVMQNKVYIDTFGAMGSNAVPMAFSEVYSALETKTVDGQENPVAIIDNMKYYEVQKYLSLTRHSYAPIAVLHSKTLWDKLSPQEQATIRECSTIGRDENRKNSREREQATLNALKTKGLQVNEIPAAELARMRERVKSVVDTQLKAIGDETAGILTAELQRIRGGK